jgi:hypothetical protein
MIPSAYDYSFPPLPESQKAENVNNSLMQYMQLAPNAPKGLFKE